LQAVILAGGLGTRLREIVMDRPKSLAVINGKPFLEYQIEFLKKYEITDIVICIGYLGKKVERQFLDGKKYGVSVTYSRERNQLGTGGALKNARALLDNRFFVLNGDTIFLTNLFDLEDFHKQNSADVTMALTRVEDQTRYGSVTLEDDSKNQHGCRIRNFSEKSSVPGVLINAGIYLMEKNLFSWTNLPRIFSLENDFLPRIVQSSRFYGFVDVGAYFVDMGTAEGYRKLEEDIKMRRIC
jgi:D-glycero-alpha-D-manno-heptose 1-phosphate guanylyltransferase